MEEDDDDDDDEQRGREAEEKEKYHKTAEKTYKIDKRKINPVSS